MRINQNIGNAVSKMYKNRKTEEIEDEYNFKMTQKTRVENWRMETFKILWITFSQRYPFLITHDVSLR